MKTNRNIILKAAREEFVTKGYSDASLRIIAREAGITVSGLYRHFASKEELFEAVLTPMLIHLEELTRNDTKEETLELYHNNQRQFEQEMIMLCSALVNNYRLELRLYLTQSEGSQMTKRLESFINDQVIIGEQFVKRFNEKYSLLGNNGNNNNIPPAFMRIATRCFIELLRELVTGPKKNDNELTALISYYTRFVSAGWREILGFIP